MRKAIVLFVLAMFWMAVRPAEPTRAAAAGRSGLPAGASQEWWSQVRENLRAEEYNLSVAGPEAPGTHRAFNRAQGFATTFDGRGLRLEPVRRDEKAPAWSWGLELLDRTADGGRPTAAEARVEGNRIEFDRGWVTEWYVNSPEGLEQGFTLSAPPIQSGVRRQESGVKTPDTPHLTPHEVFLDLALSGTLHPKFAEDGQAVDFWDSGNIAVLRFAKLKVTDATGRELPARFEGFSQAAPDGRRPTADGGRVFGGGIRIVVDDSDAVYPVTVDPLATSPAWTAQGDQSGSLFGWSVSTAGDVNGDGYSDTIVGAPAWTSGVSTNGRVYLYLGSASGPSTTFSWNQVGGGGAGLGETVSAGGDINGDGYSDWLISASGGPGVLYVVYGDPACNFDQDSLSEDSGEGYAAALAAAGDVNGDGYADIVVTEPYYGTSRGKVFLYLGSRSGVVRTASWTVLGENDGDKLGASAAIAGDVNGDGYSDLVVGATGFGGYTGKAYLYLGGPSGLSPTAAWTATGLAANNLFGGRVLTAGDTDGDGYADVLVGAPGYGSNTGRAYLYRGGASGLSTSPSWTATGEATANYFSDSLAPAGDINGDGYADVVAGAYGYVANTGKVYLYLGGASGLSASASWTYGGAASGDRVGNSVMTAGDVNGDGYSDLLVGAKGVDRAYLFTGSASGPAAAAGWAGAGETVSNYYGWSLASAGDVNGDGYSDVVVGAYNFNSTTGMVYLYLGSATGLVSSPSWTATGEAASSYFGQSVASAGDVNGDGYSDVVIGAKSNTSGLGKAYLYQGSSTGLSASPAWTATGDSTGVYFGGCVASAGDVNGDGYSDVLIGAYGYSGSTGRAYLYLGGVAGLSSSSSWTGTGETVGDNYSYSLATAGDVNGDGYSDVVVGAYRYNSDAGKAYVYLGGASGLSPTASWAQAGADVSYRFGMGVATAGDVNGDGYSDVVIGANFYNGRMGKAYVYGGGPAGLSASYSWTANGEMASAGFGQTVYSAGDVNGDGYSDILVGSPQHNSNQGKAYVYLGSASGVQASAAWTGAGAGATDRYGYGLAAAGDVNGDGFSDILVGAPYATTSTGSAALYLGNGGAGKTVRLRQSKSDLSAPVAPGGNAYEQTFRLRMLLRSPFGRVWTKVAWQTTPLLGTFDLVANPPRTSYRWWDPGTGGITPAETVDVSTLEGPWTWRARALYSPAQSPFQAWGRWLSISANGLRETDLRSVTTTGPPACVLPDEPCWLYSVTKSGTDYTLNFQDPNQPNQRTGWNIRRSNDPAPPKSSWPLVGSNVVDMDAGAVNYQWTDHSNADPGPGGVWYYEVTTFNANCPAEGPF